MLKSDILWPSSRRFKSRTQWEPIGFFSEALCNSTSFDLKLGFFSSSAINILADGFAAFLYNGGRMRLIINDILSEDDKEAITKGNAPESIIPAINLDDIESLRDTLSNRSKHFFECLAWLIKNNRVEVIVIRPTGSDGISHCKTGCFSDGINKVAFDGSCNFSRTALIENIESISAFCDWDGQGDSMRVKDIEDDFENTFIGADASVEYIDSSEIRTRFSDTFGGKEIVQLLEEEAKIVGEDCQQSLPNEVLLALVRAKKKIESILEREKESKEVVKSDEIVPAFPYGTPRDYQVDAFVAWKNNKQKGLFAMATGTGKTLTSLNCLLNIYKVYNFYKAIILVPTITLVDQWEQECRKFHFDNIIKVCSINSKWKSELDLIKTKEEINLSEKEQSYVIIATYASFAREKIFNELVSFPKKATRQILLIADEAHNMGAKSILNRLKGIKFLRRIGLSATPERQFDVKGNNSILDFFGCDNGYTFEYTMRDAIDNGFLCRYYYYPHLVRLTNREMGEYLKISRQLAKYYGIDDQFVDDEIVMALLLKRKRIIHKAQNKEEIFKDILDKRFKEKGHLKYTLVYVPEGTQLEGAMSDVFESRESVADDSDSFQMINRYTQIVQDVSQRTTVRQFVSDTSERNRILEDFAKGDLEVLTSMKCLDEGVDVPRSELAIFCASTGNPRQFVQRRGRILRNHPDKQFAIIHDLVVVPEVVMGEDSYRMERNLLKGELKRVRDFANLSENASSAFMELEEVLDYYNLSIF